VNLAISMKVVKQFRHIEVETSAVPAVRFPTQAATSAAMTPDHAKKQTRSATQAQWTAKENEFAWDVVPINYNHRCRYALDSTASYLAIVNERGHCSVWYLDTLLTQIVTFLPAQHLVAPGSSIACLNVCWNSAGTELCVAFDLRHHGNTVPAAENDAITAIVVWDLQRNRFKHEVKLPFTITNMSYKENNTTHGHLLICLFGSSEGFVVIDMDVQRWSVCGEVGRLATFNGGFCDLPAMVKSFL
jgi:hypothetical protein